MGFFQPGTRRGTLSTTMGSLNTVPFRMLRMVPLGLLHIFFSLNSFTRASSGVMVAHLMPTPLACSQGMTGMQTDSFRCCWSCFTFVDSRFDEQACNTLICSSAEICFCLLNKCSNKAYLGAHRTRSRADRQDPAAGIMLHSPDVSRVGDNSKSMLAAGVHVCAHSRRMAAFDVLQCSKGDQPV